MTTVPSADAAGPEWRRIAERLRQDALADGVDAPDPADFDLDDDCRLGGCCAQRPAYLEAVERAAAPRAARGSA